MHQLYRFTDGTGNPKERFYPAIFVQDTGMAYQFLPAYQEKHANASDTK